MNIKDKWDQLHEQPRFRPRYPSEQVVQWTFRNFPREDASKINILDLGCGAGRHSIFLAREGFSVTAADFSKVGVEETLRWANSEGLKINAVIGTADNLDFPDQFFDGVLCHGVLDYLTYDGVVRAIKEIRRVLKPGGKAFVVTRTEKDSRCDKKQKIGPHTYKIVSLGKGAPSDVEVGMEQVFLDYNEVQNLFKDFKELSVDRCSITLGGGSFTNDDWLIYAVR